MRTRISIAFLALLLSACASYYRMNERFNRSFEDGDLERAEKVLAGNKKAPKGKAQLLYYLNRGVVASMQGNFEDSNDFLERAYEVGEDLRNNYWNVATSLLINPMVAYYTGEDHELLLLHYYKALNYLQLGNTQAALVECKRMNIKLTKFSSQYKSGASKGKVKYHRDAFIHTLMGIIYEADRDYNNAFIAYRNAVDIYQEDYLPMFGLDAPEQLQRDLLRTAHRMGFTNELQRYEKLLGRKYKAQATSGGELVFFWNNGLGPVKSEWNINFALIRGRGGAMVFQNDELGWNFPFAVDSDEEYEEKGLDDIELVRVAFPKYVERSPYFTKAQLQSSSGTSRKLELAQDINSIAFHSLRQRMFKEFGISLLRVALKKAAEYGVRSENEDLGAIIGLVNALTERADTRNWQTIPHSISYTRLSLPTGEQSVKLQLSQSNANAHQHDFTYTIRRNRTTFGTFHSLESTSALFPYLSY
ncbi:COG3014 family protein [Tunicatimonas pelagia]|uniref:COG3014 family protein n=1 Tax=Tunicatimonas pelagia TaxID=931531 RepID=UPI002666A8F1|nr:hypothetical protein [Tunicatimonas pelagia]WKN40636.1 hypothetical protein P0M28_16480 [Tunicatimonas pelagia]